MYNVEMVALAGGGYMGAEGSRRGGFEFRADIREVGGGAESFTFTIGAATDGVVRGPHGRSRLTSRALSGMRAQGVIPIISGPGHLPGMSDPFTIIGEGVPVESADGELVVQCELYRNHPYAADLYDKVRRRPEWYKASIGGLVPKEAVTQQVVRGAEGRSELERVIDDCPLDHIYFCRARSALDKGTWVSAESRSEAPGSFAEAVFRAAEEVFDPGDQDLPDLALLDQLEGRTTWSEAELAAMPDECFLYQEPGGARHLPVKDAQGNWSCEHLAAAEARADQIVLENGQRIGEDQAARLKAEAGRLYQAHCATEGRCAVPGAGTGETGMEKEEVRSETEGLLARAVVGLLDLLHLRSANQPEESAPATAEPTPAPPPAAASGPEPATASAVETAPPAAEPEPVPAAPDLAAMLTPVVEGVTAMTAAVQELLSEIKAGQSAPPPTEEPKPAETPAPAAEEKPAANEPPASVAPESKPTEGDGTDPKPEKQPAAQPQEQAGPSGSEESPAPTEAAPGGDEAPDTANLQKWFELTANTLQAVQSLAGQVEMLTQRLGALEGARGVSVQPATPGNPGPDHEHRAYTPNTQPTNSADTIFRDAAHAAGLTHIR